jgi:hypothetical protein
MIDGHGDPNASATYQSALEVLYGLAYTVKMSKMSGNQPVGYYDFVVPPLEGLWSTDTGAYEPGITEKSAFRWTSMVRLPEFVTHEVFLAAKINLTKKKPNLDLSAARLEEFTEGLCAQVLHIGPYDNELSTILALRAFIVDSGYKLSLSDTRRHHELYLNDPRRISPDKLKTVIRLPVIK